jgi:hypothetical protein
VISEEEALHVVVKFGEAFTICNEESWLFKPQSLLPCDPEIVAHAMKVSYETGFPLPEKLARAHSFCFPQLSYFIPDDQFDRANAYLERFNREINGQLRHSAIRNYTLAMAHLNSAPGTALFTEPLPGHSMSGAQLVAHMDDFFTREFLRHAPDDPDKKWVQQLASDCWQDFRARDAEWAKFSAQVESDYMRPTVERTQEPLNEFADLGVK